MPLSRLENFLKNVDGNVIYVNPTDLDATDSIENQGNSLTRPFKTIQRALLEASRFSYQVGQNNDKFDRTTIMLYPGVHEIDNRPGFNVVNASGNASFRDRLGNSQTLNELTETSNYNLEDPDNILYKYNSVEGGVIVPRGVSLAGYDVRKTKIRPKFVPDPNDLSVSRAAVFRLTGACHFYAMTFFDGDPQGSVYKNYSTDRFSPQFSHHKLTCFEYADGVNGVGVGTSSTTTDLQMYFHKIQKAFGDSSGRAIGDFPGTADMQPSLPEFEIVGPVKAENVGINSIKAGNGQTPDQVINVITGVEHGLVVDSPIRVAGVNTFPDIYNGNFVVSEVQSPTEFSYIASAVPGVALPTLDGDEEIVADTDNVTGASPYIFHCSMRSAYGMCGLHADGSKASGFKSMLVSQFTGIGLQKDNNAFLVYNKTSGQYDTNDTAPDSEKPLYLNGNAIYRPNYKSAHIETSNDGYIQAVSIFAVGFSEHFTTSEGGDMSITNSNSNFGAVALNAKGFKPAAFAKDNRGYITHIIPPENQFKKDISVEWEAINVTKTVAAGSSNPSKIYLDGFTDSSTPPVHVIAGYRVGAKSDELLHVSIAGVGTVTTPIRMLNPTSSEEGDISIKEYEVQRTGASNSISSSVITLRSPHKLHAGESIRVLSDSGYLPDGIDSNVIYFAITNDSTGESLNTNQIKLARSKNDALIGGSGNFITINNNKGGVLKVQSRVSDKKPGDLAHPIQYDTTVNNWYVKASNSNTLFTQVAASSEIVGERTGKTFIKRKEDTRSLNDKIYRLRYVIPKESLDARPPIPGYTLQESNTVGVVGASEFVNNIPDVRAQRNLRILKSIDRASTGITTVVTEKPHNLIVGDQVQFRNVKSGGNSNGTINVGYNIVTDVVGVTSSKGFKVQFVTTDPGTFTPHTARDNNLPVIARWKHKDTFTVYRSETVKAHDFQRQDGVYHLICVDSSISPTVNEFTANKFNQNITDLYPQFDADNFTMDPEHAASFALNEPIGKVVTNDLRNSVTKEFTNNFIVGNRIGHAVTFAEGSSNAGIVTIFTNVEHNLNTITSLNVTAAGTGYGSAGTLYNIHLTGGSGHGATAEVTVNGSGQVTAVKIIDGGSGYTVGNTLTLQAGNTNAQVNVTAINNNIGDAIQIIGVGSTEDRYNSGYNGIHTITAVTPKSVSYDGGWTASIGIHSSTLTGIHTGFFMLAGNAPNINSVVYSDKSVGIVTVTTDEPHGLSVNNSFKIVGAAQTIYNGEHIIFEKIGITTFSFKLTEPFTPATYTTSGGKAQILPVMYGAKGGVIQEGSERLDQRQIPLTVGLSTTLNNATLSATNTTLTLTNSSGFDKGDYLQIDEEIIRVSSAFSSNQATVLRGQLGSRADSHVAGSVVKRIRILAVEKRRASVLRASGHTFEYLGYGPGNYSTAFPEKQNKILTREAKFLAQSTIDNGGSVVYTGVNDAGDFHIGNKVVNSQDGTEATFNIPVPTTTGSASADSDATSGRLDVIFDSAFIREGMTVDGNNNTTVRINAPTTITEKLTVTSTNGAEFHSIDLTGGLSPARTITYAQTTPTGSGTVGDIVYTSDPSFGQYIGWVFTPQGWKRFGLISTERDSDTWVLGDQNNNGRLGIGTTAADRAGVNANFRGALDVRGQVVADKLLMTGISTFLGTTIFADVTIGRLAVTGSLDVTGVTTFSKQVIVGAGITANELMVTGISTFSSSGQQVIMQFKTDKTASASNVNHIASPSIITINSHGYSSGEKVQYIAGSTPIGGLTDRRAYFIVRQSDSTFSLATTAANATPQGGGSPTLIDFTSSGAGTHTFKLLDRSSDATAAALPSGVALTVDQLKVIGIATFPQQVTLTNVNIGSATFSDPSTFNGTLTLNGNLTANQPVTFNSTFNANGHVNLGDTENDTITAIGQFDSDLIPDTDGTYNIGAATSEWNNLFIDGTANIDTLLADTAKIGDLTDNRVVIAGANGELEDSGNLTFNGSTLALTGSQTISSNLTVTNNLTTENDVTFEGSDNAVGLRWDKSDNNLEFGDNHDIIMGDGSDLRIWHSNSHSYIRRQSGGVGDLFIDAYDSADIRIRNGNGSTGVHDAVECYANNYVALNYQGEQKLRTNSTGIQIYSGDGSGSGSITAGDVGAVSLVAGTAKISDLTDNRVVIAGSSGELEDSGNLTFNGSTLAVTGSQTISSNLTVTNNLTADNDFKLKESNGDVGLHWDKSDNALTLNNDIKLKLGELAAGDTQIYSTGAHFYLDNNDGHIYIRNNVDGDDGGNIYLQAKSGENGIIVTHDSHVRLYHDNEEKVRTNGSGITVYSGAGTGTGTVTANLSGNASTATKWAAEKSFDITGEVTGSAVNFDGSSNINFVASIANNVIDEANLKISNSASNGKFLQCNTSASGSLTWADVPDPYITSSNFPSNTQGDTRVITSTNTSGGIKGNNNLTFDNSNLHVHGTGRNILSDGNIIAYNTSDITFKDNVQPITNAVEKVLSISGNTFTWNDKAPESLVQIVGKEDTGVIAQEVDELGLPGVVQTKEDGTKGVRYEKLVPLLIEAIKELKAEIDELKK